jgi:hypothetical protein
MTPSNDELKRVGDDLYERFGKPLETEHWGEFVAIFPDGQIVLGASPYEVVEKAVATIGKGSHVFKVGEKAIGRIR